jgi:hypothetical protein
MIFTIPEIYCEAIRQDTTSEPLDIELQRSKFILQLRGVQCVCTTGDSVHMNLAFQFQPYILQQRKLLLYINNLSQRTVCKMRKWIARKVDPLQIPSDSVVAFVIYLILLNHKTPFFAEVLPFC